MMKDKVNRNLIAGFIIAIVATLTLTALLSATTTGAKAANFDVDISGFAFSPTPLTISIGDTVTWHNLDGVSHTVTDDLGSFDSGIIAASGGTWSYTFNTVNTYNYSCSIHTSMHGKIIVQAPVPELSGSTLLLAVLSVIGVAAVMALRRKS